MFNPIELYKEIKALLAIKGQVQKMKLSELSTSTGRMVWITNIAAAAAALIGILPAALAIKVIGLLVGVYALYRTVAPALEAIAKLTPTTKDDEALAELKAAVDALTAKYGTPKLAASEKGTDNVPTPQK